MALNRREFVQVAAAMGASLAWGGSARASTTGWLERRDLYPEGVASGDPDPSSVILWTRRPFESGGRFMRGWVLVAGDRLDDPELDRWLAEAYDHVLTLPCFPELTDDEIDRVCEVLGGL